MSHKLIIVTREAKRLAEINVAETTSQWVSECKTIATQWCKDNNMTFMSYFPAMGNVTVWVE